MQTKIATINTPLATIQILQFPQAMLARSGPWTAFCFGSPTTNSRMIGKKLLNTLIYVVLFSLNWAVVTEGEEILA
jgi:hypothetical protein